MMEIGDGKSIDVKSAIAARQIQLNLFKCIFLFENAIQMWHKSSVQPILFIYLFIYNEDRAWTVESNVFPRKKERWRREYEMRLPCIDNFRHACKWILTFLFAMTAIYFE